MTKDSGRGVLPLPLKLGPLYGCGRDETGRSDVGETRDDTRAQADAGEHAEVDADADTDAGADGQAGGDPEVQDFVRTLKGADWRAGDLRTIREHLRVVSNNTSTTPNGGTSSASRRQPLAPEWP